MRQRSPLAVQTIYGNGPFLVHNNAQVVLAAICVAKHLVNETPISTNGAIQLRDVHRAHVRLGKGEKVGKQRMFKRVLVHLRNTLTTLLPQNSCYEESTLILNIGALH